MAPALTQDSQPELLLPYLTTPPYTPSPPSLVSSTSTSTCATTSSTSPFRSSCTNMEVPPYGGNERQHSPVAAPPLDTNTDSAHIDDLDLKIEHPSYKLSNFDDSISVDRRLVSAEPTPPHSTDSSAPLSPLPEKCHVPLSPLQSDKITTFRVSADRAQAQFFALSTPIFSENSGLLQNLNEEEPMPCSFSFTRDDLGSVNTASQSSHFGLLSPSSPDKTEASSSSSADTLKIPTSESVSKVASSTILSAGAIVAPNSCVTATVASAATPGVAGVGVVASDTAVVATVPSSAAVDSTASCTRLAATSKSTTKPRIVLGISSSSSVELSVQEASMGCSVQVDNKAGGRCSAPQPNDTPPPPYTTISLPTKMTASPGIFDDGLLTTLPDDCFRTLDRLVSTNPELLDELSNCPGNTSTAVNSVTISPVDNAVAGSSVSNVIRTPTSASSTAFSNQSQLVNASLVSSLTSALPVSSRVANLNSLVSYSSGQAGSVPTVTPVALPMTPEAEASTILSSLSVRQLRLQKRQAQLLRRVRRLTGRGLASSVSTQLNQLIKHGRPLLMADVKTSNSDFKEVKSENIINGNASIPSSVKNTGLVHQPPPRYDTAVLKGMSTANLISFVRQMETRSSAAAHQKPPAASGAPTSQLSFASPSKNNEDFSSSVCFSENLRYELQTISGEVKASARLHVEHDSDATESSSGGESCDELDQDYAEEDHSDSRPICERALYRYETARAAIATRWGWLQAQLADVECKIHQHARARLRLRHLNRHNTSSLSDRPANPRLSANPVLTTRPPYTCVTRTNINGITINGATAAHTKTTWGGVTNRLGIANNCRDTGGSLKTNGVGSLNNPSNGNTDATLTHRGGNDVSRKCTDSMSTNTKDINSPRSNNSCINNDTNEQRNNSCTPLSSLDGANNDGCARTKGLRWHRKRRWIRVGNIFEHRRGRVGEELSQRNTTDQLVPQPTLGVHCRCTAPSHCVMCTKLRAQCNVPRSSGSMYSNTSSNNGKTNSGSNNNGYNNVGLLNGMQTPLKKALSSASLSPSPTHSFRPSLSPIKFTSPRYSVPFLSGLLLPSASASVRSSELSSNIANIRPSGSVLRTPHPQTQPRASNPASRITDTSTAVRAPDSTQPRTADTTQRAGSGLSRSADSHASEGVSPGVTPLCKNAWYPRVAISSRISLSKRKPQLLHERLASQDLCHHPLLSRRLEIPLNVRTENVLKSSIWREKIESLVMASSEEVEEFSDATTSLSGALTSSLPGYCSRSSNSSRRHNNSGRRRRRHGGDDEEDELYTPHKTSAKKKKKSKDKMKQRSKDRDAKRKEKKKKAFKRKEKLEQKGRLTLRLRKSSVTGELVATPSCVPHNVQLNHYEHDASNESGRGRGRHNLPLIPDDSSSIHSSSRASSPSLPPHSPVETRILMQMRPNSSVSDVRPLSRNNVNRPHSPDAIMTTLSSVSTAAPRTVVSPSATTGSRFRSNLNKPSHTTLDRSISSSADLLAASGLAARRATVHSSITTAVTASTTNTSLGPLSAPVLVALASPAVTATSSAPAGGLLLTPAAAAAVALKNKQGAASYDIDNIVIPYNMASVTRVERIEYKEIVTPKWREIDEPLPLQQTSCPVLEEDVSEATVIARHKRSEELERKRFAAHLTTGGTRHGGNARMRQRSILVSAASAAGTSSTGTNTPDNPLSPHVDVSDLTTPPATPLALSEDSNHSSESAIHPSVTTEDANVAGTCDLNQHVGETVGSSTEPDSTERSFPNESFHKDAGEKKENPLVERLESEVSTLPLIAEVSSSALPTTSPVFTSTIAGSNDSTCNVPITAGAVSGPRKIRNVGHSTVRLRTSSNNSNVTVNEEEGSAREASPYSVRKFPLSDSQYAIMVQENSEVIPCPALAGANHPLLRSLDYDDLGEPSSDELEKEPDQGDEATSNTGESNTNKKRKNFESNAASHVTESDGRKRQKRSSISISVPDASDDSGVGIGPTNLTGVQHGTKSSRKIDESYSRPGRNSFSAVRKSSALVSLKDHLKKHTEADCGSEGRSSPLSEVTDSAAEDEMTGDLSDSSKPPDWTISATANSAGHCVMQVLRH